MISLVKSIIIYAIAFRKKENVSYIPQPQLTKRFRYKLVQNMICTNRTGIRCLEQFIDLSSKVKSHIPADILEPSVDGRHNPIGTVTSCGTALEFNVFTLHPLLPLAWDNSWLCRFHKDLLLGT